MATDKSPFVQLCRTLQEMYEKHGLWKPEMLKTIPKKWEKHGNLVLLPDAAFATADWQKLGYDSLWPAVAKCLRVERLARKRKIQSDDFRSPDVDLLYGSDGWVEHIDNQIRYRYDITKCMFSIGNIPEKLRIANFKCQGETIVDLFAGIGYFTLPYLVHAGASHVYACEWNPDSVAALKANIILNDVADRCDVLEGDCRKVCPSNVADRVNLGLLPTARQYWLTACRALKKSTGGVLHIHECITSAKLKKFESIDVQGAQVNGKSSSLANLSRRNTLSSDLEGQWSHLDEAWQSFAHSCAEKCTSFLNNFDDTVWCYKLLRIGKIKSFAPHIDHIVVDCEFKPVMK